MRTISVGSAAGCGLSSSRGPPGRGRLVARYQVALAGRVAGSAVATTSRVVPSGPHHPSVASAAHHVSVWPSRKVRGTACQSPGSRGPPQAGTRAASTGEWAWSARARIPCRGLNAITNGTTRWASSQRKPSWSPYAQSAATARKDTPACFASRASGSGLQFRAEPGVVLPLREVMGRRVGDGVQWMVEALVRPTGGHRDDAAVDPPDGSRVLLAHVRGRRPVLAVAHVGIVDPRPRPRAARSPDPRATTPRGGCRPARGPRSTRTGRTGAAAPPGVARRPLASTCSPKPAPASAARRQYGSRVAAAPSVARIGHRVQPAQVGGAWRHATHDRHEPDNSPSAMTLGPIGSPSVVSWASWWNIPDNRI